MSETNGDPLEDLRKRAAEVLRERAKVRSDGARPASSRMPDGESADERALIEELQVHELELEMQNEELREAQAELHDALVQYRELYDFAPVGYMTLDQHGVIQRANLKLAQMFGVERAVLRGKALSEFVRSEDQDSYFRDVRSRTGQEGEDETELRFDGPGEPFWGHLKFFVEADQGGEGYTGWYSLTDVSRRKGAEKAVEDSRDRLRRLAQRLDWTREEERKRLARDLHDDLGQSLVVLGMDLALAKDKLPEGLEDLGAMLEAMRVRVGEAVDLLNRKLVQLRPPEVDVLGLSAAIELELAEMAEKAGLKVSKTIRLEPGTLGVESRVQVLRIFEGALTNVLRHAKASSIAVTLESLDGRLVLEVSDDGIGITPEQIDSHHSIGIISMRERALRLGGEVRILTPENGGTLLQAEFPFPIQGT